MRTIHLKAFLILSATLACTTSTPTGEPGVTREGKWRVWFTGPVATVEVGYLWADRHLGDEWLVLKVGIAGAGGPTTVTFDGIRLYTPEGRTVEPLDQAGFRSVHGQLRMGLDRINAWEGPSPRFMAHRRPSGRWFITPPFPQEAGWFGETMSVDSVYPSRQVACGGPLVFQVPVAVQPGRWVLVIDFEEGVARVPFEIESVEPD
jgi:hypothetical protein